MPLVIFDNDGVLVDSEEISNTVLAECLTGAGLPTTLEDSYATYQGMVLDDIAELAGSKLGRPLPDGFMEGFERERAVRFATDLAPIAGAAKAVAAAKQAGFAVCVASQGGPNKIRETLTQCGMLELFGEEALFSARAVERPKPFPDLFLHAAETMGFEPGDCVVVEDSPSGVEAGVAAGMRVLGYAGAGRAEEMRAAGAETTFTALTELPSLLGSAR